MKRFVCYTLTAALTFSLCACSRSGSSTIDSEMESGSSFVESSSSFVEVSDPFVDKSSPETESDDTFSGVGDGYDYIREGFDREVFDEDYIDYMKHGNGGTSWDNKQFKADGKNCIEDSLVTYGGGEMEISFSETTYTDAGECSTGYMVFIGGTPQIITFNGSEPSTLGTEAGRKDHETKECKINFTPRLTQEDIDNKDNLKLTLVHMNDPLYLTAGSVEKRLDFEHSASLVHQVSFKLEGDCELIELVSDKSFEHFNELDRAVRDYLWESLSRLEDKNNVRFELYSAEKEDKPVIKDGKADIALLIYGSKQKTVYKVYFYVNHEPVKIDGCDYITAELKEGFVSKYTVTLDNVKEGDFVYAIAVAGLDGQRWVLKTDTRRLWLFTSN